VPCLTKAPLLVGEVFGMEGGLDMRWNALACLGAAFLGILGSSPRAVARDVPLVRHHFAGMTQITSLPDMEVLRGILALPESRRLQGEAERKLAIHLPTWFGAATSGATAHGPALVPLVQAALQQESYLEVMGTEAGVGSWAVAVRMEEGPAAEVGKALRGVLAPLLGSPAGGTPGADWELSGTGKRTPAARFARLKGWALVGSGKEAFEGMRDRIEASGVPTTPGSNEVSRLEADLARLAPLLGWAAEPVLPVNQWPAIRMSVEPRKGRLRTTADVAFAQPLGLKLEPWTLPKGVLRDPLVGFTAMQGADHWLKRLGLFTSYGITEWPKQLFLWSVAGDACNQYVAGPLSSPTNLLNRLAVPLPEALVQHMNWRGKIAAVQLTNQAMRVELRGMPYMFPFLQSIRSGETDMLYGGLFPQTVRGGPAPEPLLQQVIGRTNLVLYDWETTGRSMVFTNLASKTGAKVLTNATGRLTQIKQLGQFWRVTMSTNNSEVPVSPSGEIWVPGWDWINAAHTQLGDTITEVTQTGPSELSVVRSSQIGFNALELAHLLRWIENPAFPGWSDARYLPAGMKTVPVPQGPTGAAKP
jgi:hypothetical protein